MIWQWIESHPVIAGIIGIVASAGVGGWFRWRGSESRIKEDSAKRIAQESESQRKEQEWLYEEMRRRTHDLRDDLQAVKNQLHFMREQRDGTMQRLREVEEQLRDRDRRMEHMQNQLDEREREIETLQTRITGLTAELDRYKRTGE